MVTQAAVRHLTVSNLLEFDHAGIIRYIAQIALGPDPTGCVDHGSIDLTN
jgi:hypothetical protein